MVSSKFWLCLLFSGAVLFLAGCKKGPGSLIGHWQGEYKSGGVSLLGSGGAPKGVSQDTLDAIAKSVSLDLKADHTCKLVMLFTMSGTWSQSGNEITLDVTPDMFKDFKSTTTTTTGGTTGDVQGSTGFGGSSPGLSSTGSDDSGFGGGMNGSMGNRSADQHQPMAFTISADGATLTPDTGDSGNMFQTSHLVLKKTSS
jgi:hypothetical protein